MKPTARDVRAFLVIGYQLSAVREIGALLSVSLGLNFQRSSVN